MISSSAELPGLRFTAHAPLALDARATARLLLHLPGEAARRGVGDWEGLRAWAAGGSHPPRGEPGTPC